MTSAVLVPIHCFRMERSNTRIVPLQQVFKLYYLVLVYQLSFGCMLFDTLFVFIMHYHIMDRKNLQLNQHTTGKIISRISRPLVVASMFDLPVFVASSSKMIPDKVFFPDMSVIPIVFLLGMMKVLIKSKLLLMLSLMKASMIYLLTTFHLIVNIFYN